MVKTDMVKKITPMKAISGYCQKCQPKPTECLVNTCALWIYRLGKNPARKGIGGNPNFGKK